MRIIFSRYLIFIALVGCFSLYAEDAADKKTNAADAWQDVKPKTPNTPSPKDDSASKEPAPQSEASAPAPTEQEKTVVLDEVADNTGKVFKAKVLGIGEHEILIRDETGAEKTISKENLIFTRLAVGRYYFFLPDKKETEKEAREASREKAGAWEIVVGVGMHLADNSDVPAYLNEYAAHLSDYYKTTYATEFPVNKGIEGGALHWQFFVEHRFHYESHFWALGAGYAMLPKSSSVVSSTVSEIQSTINVTGFFIPVYAAYYHRVWQSGALEFNLGFGVGGMYTGIEVKTVGGPSANDQVLTSFTPFLMAKPEFTYQIGKLRILASMPIYWAQAHNVTDGEETLMMYKSRNIVTTGLSGVGLQLAVGYSY
ncbi:MAG TPA: hypothetical protein PLY93_03900 [Turneriella sp.]|nr:hypothetical protein [Turneriella sp.]